MKTLTIAYRNVVRSPKKSLITAGAIGLGGCAMILDISLQVGLIKMLEHNSIGLELGDAQVHSENYRKDADLFNYLQDPEAIISAAEAAGFKAAPRVIAHGLAAIDQVSSGVVLRGVDLEREPLVTTIAGHVESGAWLDVNDKSGVVIGSILAKKLGAKLGGELVIVGQAADGSMANQLFTVRGILRPANDLLDRAGVLMAAPTLRELLALPKGAHEIALHALTPAATVELLRASLDKVDPKAELLGWREIAPTVAKMMDSSVAMAYFTMIITYIAIVMLVMNATLMRVFERVPQFGLLRAIGATPREVSVIVLAEVFMQTAAAVVIAAGISIPIVMWLRDTGIDLSRWTEQLTLGGASLDPILRPALTPQIIVGPLSILVIAAFLSAIYPMAKAALVQPIVALRSR